MVCTLWCRSIYMQSMQQYFCFLCFFSLQTSFVSKLLSVTFLPVWFGFASFHSLCNGSLRNANPPPLSREGEEVVNLCLAARLNAALCLAKWEELFAEMLHKVLHENHPKPRVAGSDSITLEPWKMSSRILNICRYSCTFLGVCGLKHSKVLISSKPKAKSCLNLSWVGA